MSVTGFTMPDGSDLSVIFQPYTSPDAKADETGFTIFGSDLDLNSVFVKNTSATYIANDTNYTAPNGLDLRYIFEPVVPFAVTIIGTGLYTSSIVGNKYTYTFNSGTNTISINKNIPALYAFVCGGGGGGRSSNGTYSGGGGAGGGFGFVQISYVAGTEYNTSVAALVGPNTNGITSVFQNKATENGVGGTGGRAGRELGSSVVATDGGCVNVGSGIGTITSRSGGDGGTGSASFIVNGLNASGSITILGTTYNFGGGGGGGSGSGTLRGGQAGFGGSGGVSGATSYTGSSTAGQHASTRGAGGGGAARHPSSGTYNGGNGGQGIIIVTFVYP